MLVPNRPTVVCLCGSSRFYDAYQLAFYDETMQGKIVLSVGFFPGVAPDQHGESVGCTEVQKQKLDLLHLRRIDLADEILVLNIGGYIGDSTRREMEYAFEHGKGIRWWESDKALFPAQPKTRATEKDWLLWFTQEADFGPGHGDALLAMQERFMDETGLDLPIGWNFDGSGEGTLDREYPRCCQKCGKVILMPPDEEGYLGEEPLKGLNLYTCGSCAVKGLSQATEPSTEKEQEDHA